VKATKSILSINDGLPVRPSGQWINRKHYYLKRYIDIFTKGMKHKWAHELTYIDLFAGPGRCVVGPSSVEQDGSPFIALRYNFSKYIFVEENKASLAALKQRIEKNYPLKLNKVEFIEGDCNLMIDRVKPMGLALAFIDPTGLDFHFDTVRKLVLNRSVDLLMNILDGVDLKRNFKEYKQLGEQSKLALFIGRHIDIKCITDAKHAITIYKNNIRDLGYKTVECKDIPVRNYQKNVEMYFLFFASRHPCGLDYWRKITKKDDKGQFEFDLF
jgi:three-Cys-motif partner protein